MGSRAAALHVIVGTDSWLADQALESVLEGAVGSERAESVRLFRGDETGWAAVIEGARMGSLFAPRRAVVVRNAEAIKGEGEEVLDWLEDPAPDTALVLLVGKPDKRRTLWKRLLEKGAVVPADPPKGRALRGYVADQVRRRKLALTDEGLEELLERVGQDLRRLMGELDKLTAFAGGRPGALGAEDVAAVLGKGLAQPLYRLADAMGARRTGRVLELLETALDDGEPALKILATLHRALRQVRGARAARGPCLARAGRLPAGPLALQGRRRAGGFEGLDRRRAGARGGRPGPGGPPDQVGNRRAGGPDGGRGRGVRKGKGERGRGQAGGAARALIRRWSRLLYRAAALS